MVRAHAAFSRTRHPSALARRTSVRSVHARARRACTRGQHARAPLRAPKRARGRFHFRAASVVATVRAATLAAGPDRGAP
eukprot:822115-Pleurochrysis_carterae.AAC.1